MHDELWMEVHDIVHEAVIKTIPKKKKCKKAKWLSEEALQIAEKRRDAKGKGEKERYTHLNAEFQGIARRDKKVFLTDQCKEIEETIEWERLEISLRKLEIPREHFMQNEHNKGEKWYIFHSKDQLLCLLGKTSDLTFGLFSDMLLSTAISCVFPWYQTNSTNRRLYTKGF